MKWIVKVLIVFVLLSYSVGALLSQNYNRIRPPHLFDYEFQIFDSTNQGYFLFTPFDREVPAYAQAFKPLPLIMDENGYVLWYGSDTIPGGIMDLKYLDAQDQYLFLAYLPSQNTVGFLLNAEMQTIDTIFPHGGNAMDQHDLIIRPNNVRTQIRVTDSVFDLSSDTILGAPGLATSHCRCYILQELDASDQLQWEWNSCAHLHPRLGYDFFGYNPGDFNYAHLNSLSIDDVGNYLLSFRHMSAVVKVNRQTGNVDWILGGKANQFTFTNTAAFTAQHYAQVLPNGNISIFDNALLSANTDSRAIQLEIDTFNMTATEVFAYTGGVGCHSPAMGSYQVTDSVQLINYGVINRPWPSAELIDANKQVHKRIYFQDSVMSYRGILYHPKAPFPRPEVRCIEEQGIVYLTAPEGFDEYLWSNGDTSRRVIPLVNETYQVWVNYGIGMLGSEPFETGSSFPCLPVSATPYTSGSNGQATLRLIGYYDLLGRKVNARKSNHVYIERFSNGLSRKVLFVE